MHIMAERDAGTARGRDASIPQGEPRKNARARIRTVLGSMSNHTHDRVERRISEVHMARRLLLFSALFALTFAVAPRSVGAQSTGPASTPQTYEVDGNMRLPGVTGNCSCNNQTYAVGFRPGAVSISATLK